MGSRHYKYDEQRLREVIKNSDSLHEVLSKLGLKAAGGNYQTLNKKIREWKIDISHFTGMLWSKGKKLEYLQKPIQYYLVEKCETEITSHKLRQRLINENIFPKRCNRCRLEKWLDRDIPLELEHKNGIHSDNRLENLELLCPNCHSLTKTYCRRKSKLAGMMKG